MKRLFTLFLFLVGYIANAKQEYATNSFTPVVNQEQSVQSLRYTTSYIDLSQRSYWIENTYGVVKLKAGDLSSYPASLTSITVTADIEYTYETNTGYLTKIEQDVELSIAVNTTEATDVSYFVAPNALFVTVRVKTINKSANVSGFVIEASIVTNSFDKLINLTAPTGLIHEVNLTAAGFLRVSWDASIYAENYELEWTYISNQGEVASQVLTLSELMIPAFYFKNNSSRVEVKGNTYDIPLIYEKGYILYRLRLVGKNVVNSTPVWQKTEWTYSDNGQNASEDTQISTFPVANAYLYDGLENNINWQSSLSFAEEGKNKVIVSYHDGSSRSRQAVTRINTDDRTIIGETFYDYNGRPVIQTLPAPVQNSDVNFSPNLNVPEGSSQAIKDNLSPTTCDPVAPTFNTSSGSSNYYSPNNTFGSDGNTGNNVINRDLIPDAKKYPYTQTQYTADNTGRIAAQSGVGQNNTIGSGKETRYLYGTPLQTELCRLFGNQVGYAAHYKKNVVVDPNGQVSVSYLDLDGKVIATALAGGSPSNVDSISVDGNNDRNIVEDVLTTNPMSNMLSPDGMQKNYTKKLVVTSNQIPYTISYAGSFGYYDIACSTANPTFLSLSGAVDVNITLTDKCGVVVYNSIDSTKYGFEAKRQSVVISSPQDLKLSTGEYLITKSAVINEDKFNAYLQYYFELSSCSKTIDDFIDEEMQSISLADCDLTCNECNARVDSILAANVYTQEEIEDLRMVCSALCNENVGCTNSLNMMLADVSIGGQYAQIRDDKPSTPSTNVSMSNTNSIIAAYETPIVLPASSDNKIQPENFPLSIYNSKNRLHIGKYLDDILDAIPDKSYWRYPLVTIPADFDISGKPQNYIWLRDQSVNATLQNLNFNPGEYLDRNGEIFYVYVQKLNDQGDYSPKLNAAMMPSNKPSPLILVDEATSLYKVPVRYLSDISEFEKYWQPHWAYNLLPYHPEFPYYIDCKIRSKVNDFDYRLLNMSYNEAVSSGYILSGAPKILHKEDSLDFSSMLTPYYFLFMAYAQNNFAKRNTTSYSMLSIANQMINCPNGTPISSCNPTFSSCNNDKIDNEDEWRAFVNLYYSKKQAFIKLLSQFRAVNGGYFNGCIGNYKYLSSADAYYFNQPKIVPTTITSRTCYRRYLFFGGCITSTYTINRKIPSYMDPSQLCFIGNARHLSNKEPRFFPSFTSDIAQNQNELNCVDVQQMPDMSYTIVPIACESDLEVTKQDIVNTSAIAKYELCGLCPAASDVEAFLSSMVTNKLLVPNSSSTYNLISCPKDNIIFGLALSNYLGITNTNTEIYWNVTSNNINNLSASLVVGNQTKANITLTIPTSSSSNNIFSKLISLCCMGEIQSMGNNLYSFRMKGYFSNGNSPSTSQYVNGTIDFNILSCDIPPSCSISEKSISVMNLFNLLHANNHFSSTTPINLLSNTEAIGGLLYSDIYFDAVVELIGLTDEDLVSFYNSSKTLTATWSYVSSTGTLTYSIDGISYTVPFMFGTSNLVNSVNLNSLTPDLGTVDDQPKKIQSVRTTLPPSSSSNQEVEAWNKIEFSIIEITDNTYNVYKQTVSTFPDSFVLIKCVQPIPATVRRN